MIILQCRSIRQVAQQYSAIFANSNDLIQIESIVVPHFDAVLLAEVAVIRRPIPLHVDVIVQDHPQLLPICI